MQLQTEITAFSNDHPISGIEKIFLIDVMICMFFRLKSLFFAALELFWIYDNKIIHYVVSRFISS